MGFVVMLNGVWVVLFLGVNILVMCNVLFMVIFMCGILLRW